MVFFVKLKQADQIVCVRSPLSRSKAAIRRKARIDGSSKPVRELSISSQACFIVLSLNPQKVFWTRACASSIHLHVPCPSITGLENTFVDDKLILRFPLAHFAPPRRGLYHKHLTGRVSDEEVERL